MTEAGVQNIELVAVDKNSDFDEIKERIDGADLVFVISGMDGENTSHLASEVAKISRGFTVGIVTKPFNPEHEKIVSQAICSIADLITKNGFVRIDLDDIKTVLSGNSEIVFGIGEGEGYKRFENAAKNAMTSPFVNTPFENFNKILITVTTGFEITLSEISEAAYIFESCANPDAQVIWGHVIDENLGEKVRVTFIATS